MKKQEKNVFDFYQVVAKCSDGDVVINKDGKDVFNLKEAKAIQAEHQGLGAEVILKKLDKEIINIEFDPWNFQYNKIDKTLYCTNDTICLTNIVEEEIPTALQIISVLYCSYGTIVGDYQILLQQYSSGELNY